MGRRYRLSKEIMSSQADEIMRELKVLPDVKRVTFNRDLNCLEIATDDQEYADVMTRAVNLFSRIGNGCALSFSSFV